jgi:hypothetical protein
MRRRDKAGGKEDKAQRANAVTPKRRNAPKAVRRRSVVTTDLQDQLDRRTGELNEALEQQTATSEVLRVISSSPSDAQPAFDAIAQSAARLPSVPV